MGKRRREYEARIKNLSETVGGLQHTIKTLQEMVQEKSGKRLNGKKARLEPDPPVDTDTPDSSEYI